MAAAKAPLKTRVVFRCVWDDVKDDEEIRVIGSASQLGSWDPRAAPALHRRGVGSDLWYSKPGLLLPLGCRVEYKYAMCKKTTGELVEWEDFEGNRFVVPTGLKYFVEDDNGLHRSEFEGDAMSQVHPVGETKSMPKIEEITKRQSGYLSGGLPDAVLEDESRLEEDDVAVIVVRRLPFSADQDAKTGEWSARPLVASDDSYIPLLRLLHGPESCELNCKVRFVGFPGVYPKDETEKKQITEVLATQNCIPVFLDKETVDGHYHFSHHFLWPVFHSMKVFDMQDQPDEKVQTFEESGWKSYQAFNNAYALVIEANSTPRSLVWVQDYHLLLVPRYVYLRQPSYAVGLFVHCSFPSSEVLSCLPNREEILKALLCCKVIGFQIFDYLRNFISCCQLVLGAWHSFQKGGVMQIEHESKAAVICADHFALPYDYLAKKLENEKFDMEAAEIRKRFPGKVIIGSYDKCERFSGLSLKLRLFHQYLSEYHAADRVVLLQYVVALDDASSTLEQNKMLEDIKRMASEINNEFGKPGSPPVVSIIPEHSTGHAHRLATLNAMDIYLNTSTNDGLNLVPFMFYLAHAKDKTGIAIVSEFCGCSSALTGSFKVNPFNPNAVMSALDQAMSLTPSDQRLKFAKEHSYISTQALGKWFNKNLSELKRVTKMHKQTQLFHVAGFDACFRKDFNETSFSHLNFEKVSEAYKRAKTRVLLLDVEGTLAAKASFMVQGGTALLRDGTPPDSQVLDCLQTLSEDRNNSVYVISGRDPHTMQTWFGHLKNLGLCAEHGFHYRRPMKQQQQLSQLHSEQRTDASGQVLDRGWRSKDDEDTDSQGEGWKPIAIEVMRLYVKRIQGSVLECKNSGISWNYRGLGGAALIQEVALELARFLDPRNPQSVLHDFPVKVVCGKGYVEVKRSDIDKGVAATRVFHDCKEKVDFVLCIGDDRSDEDMFGATKAFFETQGAADDCDLASPTSPSPALRPARASVRISTGREEPRPNFFTVTVGRKPSMANSFVSDVTKVSELLHKLASQSTAAAFSRYASAPSMHDLAQQMQDDGSDTGSNSGSDR